MVGRKVLTELGLLSLDYLSVLDEYGKGQSQVLLQTFLLWQIIFQSYFFRANP